MRLFFVIRVFKCKHFFECVVYYSINQHCVHLIWLWFHIESNDYVQDIEYIFLESIHRNSHWSSIHPHCAVQCNFRCVLCLMRFYWSIITGFIRANIWHWLNLGIYLATGWYPNAITNDQYIVMWWLTFSCRCDIVYWWPPVNSIRHPIY